MRPDRIVTIFDLPDLDEAFCRGLLGETLQRRPRLTEIYDTAFLDDLVVNNRKVDNFLLLLFLRPNDDFAENLWDSVIADLDVLRAEGAWSSFRGKLKQLTREGFSAARNELAVAAWARRKGWGIHLEAPGQGNKNFDFSADSSPQTWWEVKAIEDLQEDAQRAAILREVQRLLRSIDEPYVLALEETDIAGPDVAPAVKAVRKQIRAHYEAGAPLPSVFESHGLVVEATSRTRRERGYLGTTMGALHVKGSEHADKARDRIRAALKQLPKAAPCIVVIDTTVADWAKQRDVEEACFGVEYGLVTQRGLVSARRPERIFRPDRHQRLSAVVHYSRSRGDWRSEDMTVFHNPHAEVPLSNGFFGSEIRQTRLVQLGQQEYRLETSGESDPPD